MLDVDEIDAWIRIRNQRGEHRQVIDEQSIVKDFADMESKIIVNGLVGQFGAAGQGAGGQGPGPLGGLLGQLFGIGSSSAPAPSSGTTGAQAFADGGVVNRPTVALFGEGGNSEAFIPLKRGGIPVQMLGSTQHDPPVVFVVSSPDEAWKMGFRSNKDLLVNTVTREAQRGRLGKVIRQRAA